MLFNSEIFLFLFLPLVFIINYILPKKFKNYWLLISSLVFYGWCNYNFLFLLLFSIFLDFIFAILLDKNDNLIIRKVLLGFGICLNLFNLFIFKYFDFGISLINRFFNFDFSLLKLALPIGISFYTFQGISYLVDVYRKKVNVQKNIFDLALYISFFPQLVAGPIVKYSDIEKPLKNRVVSLNDMTYGIKRFIIGLGKKVILADGALSVVLSIWNLPNYDLTTSLAWIGAIYYAFQIYFDFLGYSDMAIGLGKMFGFTFPENFNYPYIASSITDFWRRWHISLSSWFKEYVYIPLGGNKKYMIRNLLIVFLLTGLWHGAGVSFIIWGLWNGLFNILEKVLKDKIKFKKNYLIVKILSHVYVIFVIIVGWVFFRADSTKKAFKYLLAMFVGGNSINPAFQVGWFLNKYNIFIGILCLIFCTPVINIIYKKLNKKENLGFKIIENVILLIIFIYSIMELISTGFKSFIYFQF